MIKEYIENKRKNSLEQLKIKQSKLLENKKKEEYLKKLIKEIQDKSDIDIEVFSPRVEGSSIKNRINENYEELEKVLAQNSHLEDEITILKSKYDKYCFMTKELEELP